jgi:hypothetical protein
VPVVVATESRGDARDLYIPPGNAMAHHADVSPDGRRIAIGQMGFGGIAGETAVPFSCFVESFDGQRGSTRGVGTDDVPCAMFVRCSRDGRWLYFSSGRGSRFHLVREPAGGGRPQQVTPDGALAVLGVLSSFVLTPDDRSVIYPSGETQEAIRLRRDAGTQAQLTRKWISVMRDGRTQRETWIFPAAMPGNGRKLWNTWSFAWMPGGRGFLVAAGGVVSSAWVLPNRSGAVLPPDLGSDPTEATFAGIGGRNVLTDYFFIRPAPMVAPVTIAYSKVVNHSNLYQLRLR